MKVQRSLLCPCVLALALAQVSLAVNNPRQLTNTSVPPASPPPATNTPQQPNTNTGQQPPPATSNQSPTATSTTNNVPTTAPQSAPPTAITLIPSIPLTTNLPSSIPILPSLPATSEEAITTTGADGEAITVTVTSSAETSSTAALPTNTTTKKADDGDGGGLSTGSIVGMSVAAGVAVIGIIGFFVWKFTRKRFSDFDDNEAIKWPELNSHSGNQDSLPLPARDTGRVGFDTGSEADLSRVNSVSNYSTPDFGAGGSDPYAIPPLPHLNPNQPYRDDPSAPSGYYDPYRGPVPGTIENGSGDWHPEAYPMTQLGGPAGRASPAPDYSYEVGRQSPALQGMYAGRNSPGPQAAYGGRGSPGPQAAYSTGRISPGPNVAYDAHGAR